MDETGLSGACSFFLETKPFLRQSFRLSVEICASASTEWSLRRHCRLRCISCCCSWYTAPRTLSSIKNAGVNWRNIPLKTRDNQHGPLQYGKQSEVSLWAVFQGNDFDLHQCTFTRRYRYRPTDQYVWYSTEWTDYNMPRTCCKLLPAKCMRMISNVLVYYVNRTNVHKNNARKHKKERKKHLTRCIYSSQSFVHLSK